jgi:hypothetical protein
MMQYLILCRFNEADWNAIPETERDELMEEYHAVLDGLDRGGKHLATAKLQPVAAGRTVRHANGRPVTDGPFMETKEHLGGYHLVEADSLEEATAIAARFPTLARGGVMEVRPLEIATTGTR